MEFKNFSYLTAVEIFLLSPDENEILLLKRSIKKKVLPGFYAGVGGKMDLKKIESPINAAYREIEEETLYKKEDIIFLKLKSIYTIFDKFGKWIIFEFVGKVNKKKFNKKREIKEGILEWVSIDKLSEINLVKDLKKGYLENIIKTKEILWVTASYDEKDNLIYLSKTS